VILFACELVDLFLSLAHLSALPSTIMNATTGFWYLCDDARVQAAKLTGNGDPFYANDAYVYLYRKSGDGGAAPRGGGNDGAAAGSNCG
jgi:hypothetical protein